MNKIEELEQRITELQQLQQREKEELQAAIVAKSSELEQAEAEKVEAMARFDAAAEVLATKKYEALATDKEILEKALYNSDHKPLVSEEEYKARARAVFDELNEANEAAKEELQQMFTKLYETAAALADQTNKANRLLKIWQEDIRRNQGDYIRGLGCLVISTDKALNYKYWHFVCFMDEIREKYNSLMQHEANERG